MGGFLANRGLLITAWFVVLAALGGALALALLQPPPVVPRTEPVTLALPLPKAVVAPPEAVAPETAEMPEGAPEAMTEATPEPAAETVPGMPEEASGETPAAAPQEEAPKEEAGETPAATAALPLPKPAPPAGAMAEEESPPGPETAPETTPEAPAPAAVEEPAEAPAAAAHGETPPEKETAKEAPAGAEPAPEAPDTEQVVAIPVIPPAPEQLPYWERYRQPFNMADTRPRIAVVLTGLGVSDSATEAAINKLPPAITLSFSPYARGLERWIALARSRGHEVMLDLPMEPATFPNEDPGPQGLLIKLSPEENLDRLDWVLSRGSAYVGVAGTLGSRFTASRSAMEPILQDVKARGLIFLDRRTTEESVVPAVAAELGLPRAINNRSIDERQASRVAIDARLAQIERIALTDGYAVAMAQPYPVTLERLADWATELTARGFVIAPISALADQQKAP
ncbi:divergent polysaccharide deacetylase family protein [Pelagibius marinus]|uniref:divergent polysaccharide deacetylase family protein n=1 Tax=Pelagibius marinus TaxID=2762760 RepID=UPI0018721F4F|nr:divergent polysaccharide deacetylase family protein [Pelagibius marinus]